MEKVTDPIVEIYVDLKRLFRMQWFPQEPDLAKKVWEALHTVWVKPY